MSAGEDRRRRPRTCRHRANRDRRRGYRLDYRTACDSPPRARREPAIPFGFSIMNEWLDDLRTAVAFLTRPPMPHPEGAMPANFARARRMFPLVGAGIGGAG